MSGSGGYAKYRCKYFSTYGCDKWVWVMNTACPYCVVSVHLAVFKYLI
jgi:hypothetical protein